MNQKRARLLSGKESGKGPVLYWMTREHRVSHNSSLLFSQELAKTANQPLFVVFSLRKDLRSTNGTRRWVDFMLHGLEEVEKNLKAYDIPFVFLFGDPLEEIPAFIKQHEIQALVTDFFPLAIYRHWEKELLETLSLPIYEVDSHNIIPCWEASPKQEFGAYTLRPKIQRQLKDYLTPLPNLEKQQHHVTVPETKWDMIHTSMLVDESIQPVDWIRPGETAAKNMLHSFLEKKLAAYETERNDPTKDAQSNLSPFLHFGHISSLEIVQTIHKKNLHGKAVDAFLEELIIRKELSDNFCYYNKNYATIDGFPAWAKQTLSQHLKDERPYTYTLKQLENAQTHDPLWNAAQKEMVQRGKMHGYMRMYWAKKIFEWSQDPIQAQTHAISLNDRYFLDGRDPNGYTGIAWSIGGVHDRAWFEREIFGKIRYMSYNGAKGKFRIQDYIASNTAA